MNLERQAAIVTGGRGIGRSIAQELAKAGMNVAVVARTQAEVEETGALLAAEGGIRMGFSTDVTDEHFDLMRHVAQVLTGLYGIKRKYRSALGFGNELAPQNHITFIGLKL